MRRFDGIDVLRGLSIFAVVMLHISIRMGGAGFSLKPLMAPWLFHLLFRNGGNGVTVFFAISGFLITYTSVRRFAGLDGMRPFLFYRVRFARIAPLLLLLLAVLALLHLGQVEGFVISPKRTTLGPALLAALTFHLNWLEAVHGYLPASWDVLWSLSVEEMFYLFFPLVCVVFARRRIGFVLLMAIFIAMGPFARVAWTANPIWQEKTYLGGTDAIAMGCLSALLLEKLDARKRLLWLAVGAGLMLWIALWPAGLPMNWIAKTGLDGSILAFGTCLVMVASVSGGWRGTVWSEPLRWLGRHSYEVYMTHEFVIVWGVQLYARVKAGPLWLWCAGMVLLSAPLGWVVARYISEPLNRKLRLNRGAATGFVK